MHYNVKSAVTLRVGIWSATVHAKADVTVVPEGDGRRFELSNIDHEPLTPVEGDAYSRCVGEIYATLHARAVQYLSGSLSLHDVLELAEVSSPEGIWRLKHDLGWVNALESQYHGVLLATNGMLGITRCNDLQFRVHSMSRWSKRRSRVVKPKADEEETRPVVRRKTQEEIDAAADALLGL